MLRATDFVFLHFASREIDLSTARSKYIQFLFKRRTVRLTLRICFVGVLPMTIFYSKMGSFFCLRDRRSQAISPAKDVQVVQHPEVLVYSASFRLPDQHLISFLSSQLDGRTLGDLELVLKCDPRLRGWACCSVAQRSQQEQYEAI